MNTPEPTVGHIDQARRFAALSGPFDPRDAIAANITSAGGDDAVVATASYLAMACDTKYRGQPSIWLMHDSERRQELDTLARSGDLPAAVQWRRRTVPAGSPNSAETAATGALLSALLGEPPMDTVSVQQLIHNDDAPREQLEQTAAALVRAGSIAPAFEQLDAINATLSDQDLKERNRGLIDQGFFGRQAELEQLIRWVRTANSGAPARAAFVSGLPGIGKSTLLDQVVRHFSTSTPPWLIIRLDFDRAGLDIQDLVGLTLELARQLAIQASDSAPVLQAARQQAAASTPGNTSDPRDFLPTLLVTEIGRTVGRLGRPILLILDTLEVLRGRGETHPWRLFDWIDQLIYSDVIPMTVIGAGRGDALNGTTHRIGESLTLNGLDDRDADRLLESLGAPADSFAEIRELADGSPLVLRLAAMAIAKEGPKVLTKVRRRKEIAGAFLYRFLLSRIDDNETLKKLASPGLIVRRISADLIAEVLGPQLGLGRLDPTAAETVFNSLVNQHWLVEADPSAPGFVKHRSDIRGPLLKLLYTAQPAQCTAIDKAAAVWYADRPESWCAVESAYHRLQMMRTDPRPPFIDSLLLRQIDADMLVELPTQAQDLVKQSRGERTSLGRGLSDSEGHVGPAEVHELEMLIERGDWLEAGYFYDQIFKTGQFDSASPAADAARAFLWRTGQWREAKDRLAERDRFSPGDHDLRGLPYQIAATRLEMRAEFGFRELLKRLRTDPGLALYAQDVVARGFRSELSAGALGFALRLCDLASTESYQRFDVVAATFATWSDGHGSDATTSFSTAQERFPWQEVSPPPHPDDAAGRARLLAILTPYSQAADSLSRLPDDDRITSHAESTVYHLRHLDGLPPRGTHPWTAPPGTARMNDITTMTGLGLFAEWVGAAAFSLRNPHLTLLARSAERWRSTTAGRWSYDSAPPAGSPSRTRLDASISDRILALADDPSPIDASREQLAAWSGDVQPVEVLLEQIAHRFPTALKDGRLTADAGPEAAARVLLDRHVPSAFVPALAILLTHQQLRIGDLT